MAKRFHDTWAGREVITKAVDLWIGIPEDPFKRLDMAIAAQNFCNEVRLCITITPTNYVYTNGAEHGWRIGLRNYPRFPLDEDSSLLTEVAENLGKLLAERGDQGSFMIEEHGGVTYWLTRRRTDGASPQTMAECDCAQPDTCSRIGCEYD